MANPQAEDGHIDIANEIAEYLAYYRLSGEEYQALWVILRKTWGWKKKSDCIALSQFKTLTKMKKSNICRALKKLENKNIIIKKDNAIANEYRFNKDFESWNPLSKKITLSKKIIPIIKKDNKSLSKKIHTKDNYTKDTFTKERRRKKKYDRKKHLKEYADYVFLTEKEYERFVEEYGEANTKKFIEKLNNYKGSHGKKYADDNLTIRNWVIDEVLKKKSKVESGIDVEAWKNLKGGSQ